MNKDFKYSSYIWNKGFQKQTCFPSFSAVLSRCDLFTHHIKDLLRYSSDYCCENCHLISDYWMTRAAHDSGGSIVVGHHEIMKNSKAFGLSRLLKKKKSAKNNYNT